MFEEAIRYPWKGEDNLKNVAIGGVLTLLGVFLLPMFFVLGYGLEVIRRVSDGDVAEPPAWEDWGTLFVDGLKVFVITVVYSLIPAAIFAFAVFSWFVPVVVSNGSEPSGGLAASGSWLACWFSSSRWSSRSRSRTSSPPPSRHLPEPTASDRRSRPRSSGPSAATAGSLSPGSSPSQ